MHDATTCQCPQCSPIGPPTEATASGKRFFEENAQALEFMHFVIHTALHGDYVKVVAREALANRELPADRSWVDLATNPPGPATAILRQNAQFLLQMMLCRIAENFETYLSDVLREALKAKPEMLKSRDEVRLDYVLRFSTLDELLDDLIDRKVSELAYFGMAKLDEWVNERMGISLVGKDSSLPIIIEAVETRNCIVHARARVGVKYLKNVPAPKFARGEVRILSPDDVFAIAGAFVATARRFDGLIATKYSLPRQDLQANAALQPVSGGNG